MLGKAATNTTTLVDRASSLESDADNATPNTNSSSSAEESSAEEEFVFSRRSHKMSKNPFSFGTASLSKPAVSASASVSEDEDNMAPVTALCRAAAEAIGGVQRELQRLQAVEKLGRSHSSDNGYSSCESVEGNNKTEDVPVSEEAANHVAEAEVTSLLESMLAALRDLRERVLDELPVHVGDRMLEEAERMTAPQDETTLLLGRCFNFSMNLKILSQSTSSGRGVRATLDETLAARLLCDLRVLERSLERRTETRGRPEVETEANAEAGQLSQLLRDTVVFQRGRRPAMLKLSAN